MRLTKVLFLLLINFSTIYGQNHDSVKVTLAEKYVKKLINDTADISKPEFLAYPTIAYSPETSWEFGLSSLFVYYAKHDTTNRLSELNAFVFYTLQKQYGALFDHAMYSHKNKWFFLGRIRFQSFPILYYGIGSKTSSHHLATVDANQLQIKERVLRKIAHNLYFGAEFDFQRLGSVNFKRESDEEFTLPAGHEGSSNLGLGFGILYDNRHNILNVRKGIFSELVFLKYDRAWLSDYNFNTIISDSRYFRPVNKRDVIALQAYGQFNFGNTPFNQLSLMGGESIMRGYYLGRYRDKNLTAVQAEYRFLPLPLGFTKRWGAAVFAASGTVFDSFSHLGNTKIVHSGGAGIRFLIFPKKDIFTRFDVAFTAEGHGFYLFIGESF